MTTLTATSDTEAVAQPSGQTCEYQNPESGETQDTAESTAVFTVNGNTAELRLTGEIELFTSGDVEIFDCFLTDVVDYDFDN